MFGALLRAALAAAIALLVSGFAARGQTVELKVSHYVPPSHTVHKLLELWSAELARRSGGRLVLKIYPAAQLGPVQRQFDLARNGQADMAVGLTGATPGRYPVTELASLPFVWPSAGSTSEIMSRRLTELAPKYLAPEFPGVRVLWAGVTPTNGLFTARKAIESPSDMRGLKVRFQGEQNAKVLRELGAIPLQIPPGDVADGLAKGVIDGAIFNFEGAESFGLASSARFALQPGFVTGSLILVMNTARYEALPADLRTLIDDTTGPDAAAQLGRLWDQAEDHGREAMIAGKVTIKPLAGPEIVKLKSELEPLITSTAASLDKAGRPATAFLNDYRR